MVGFRVVVNVGSVVVGGGKKGAGRKKSSRIASLPQFNGPKGLCGVEKTRCHQVSLASNQRGDESLKVNTTP
jgi:hypothetical protein